MQRWRRGEAPTADDNAAEVVKQDDRRGRDRDGYAGLLMRSAQMKTLIDRTCARYTEMGGKEFTSS